MILSHRDKGFKNDRGKGSRLISIHEVKWGDIGDGVRVVIVCKLGSGKAVSLEEGVVLAKNSEVDFQFLVNTLSSPSV